MVLVEMKGELQPSLSKETPKEQEIQSVVSEPVLSLKKSALPVSGNSFHGSHLFIYDLPTDQTIVYHV